ncbi:NADH-quinone oxidoreductase subunit D [Spiractinospora alimapuensis]|uniref:NADH-quinone oxidoreductase subunit D n=1 Tax=Spiractinospora alimapuensis TaxID=2820884 RepID=UPI001EEBACBC|nr:NADH-quinone oxidoreductase subunit D [Spiractinospora alimapuensis]QVQ50988.1 NADH-quinone oxidoreductase subunit D [Spiractinospora alimapuensis]
MTTHTGDPHTSEDARERVFNAVGADWDEVAAAAREPDTDRLVINMGPQHPSTHGVLRLILTLDGETVTDARAGIGYLHTGIEKNMEFRTWTQGSTFCTRMDYVMPLFNETAYCLAVEKLLGITDEVPERATVIRVLMMELNRISSHFVAIATFGLELGASTVMLNGFREREMVLDIFEMITGLRMNHAYVRPGGVAQDLPSGSSGKIREFLKIMPQRIRDMRKLLDENPLYLGRTRDVAHLDLTGCMALGVTGPVVRAAGLGWDLRKAQPYCGYENYEFDVPVSEGCDVYARYRVRIAEMEQSLGIIEQCLDRLEGLKSQPVMIQDAKIGWPAQLTIGPDGMGNSPDHIAHIMSGSMEALIHHFKLVTEGFRVPPGRVYSAIESPKGELGCVAVSDGGTRPFRVHFRDPSFTHLQTIAAMCEGGAVADVIAAVASIDPVMGGVDR